jgi:hypothetical protein
MPWLVASGFIIVGALSMGVAVNRADPTRRTALVPIAWLGGVAIIACGLAVIGWNLFGLAVKYWAHQ